MAEEGGDQGRRADGTWHQWAKPTWGSQEREDAWWMSSAHEWHQTNHVRLVPSAAWQQARAQQAEQPPGDGADGGRMVAPLAVNQAARTRSSDSMMMCAPCQAHGWLTNNEMSMYQHRELLTRLLDKGHDDPSVVVGKEVSETAWTSAVASQNNVIYHIATPEWERHNPNLKPRLLWLLHNVDSPHSSQAMVVYRGCAGVLKVRSHKLENDRQIAVNAEAIRIFFKIPDARIASLPKQGAQDCVAQKLHGNPGGINGPDSYDMDRKLYAVETGDPCGWHPDMPANRITKSKLYDSLEGRKPGALGKRFEDKDCEELRFYLNYKSKAATHTLHIFCMKCQTRVEIHNVKSPCDEDVRKAVVKLRKYLWLARDEPSSANTRPVDGGGPSRPAAPAPGWGDGGGGPSTAPAPAAAAPAAGGGCPWTMAEPAVTWDPYDWEQHPDNTEPRCWFLETGTPRGRIAEEPVTRAGSGARSELLRRIGWEYEPSGSGGATSWHQSRWCWWKSWSGGEGSWSGGGEAAWSTTEIPGSASAAAWSTTEIPGSASGGDDAPPWATECVVVPPESGHDETAADDVARPMSLDSSVSNPQETPADKLQESSAACMSVDEDPQVQIP